MNGKGSYAYSLPHMGENIAYLRRLAGLTQEMLAMKLGVSAQAISKWERQVSYPDLSLLPEMADLFDVSIDVLFSKELTMEETSPIEGLPWEDDDCLRVAVFDGRRLRSKEVYQCPDGNLVLLIHPDSTTQVFPGRPNAMTSSPLCSRKELFHDQKETSEICCQEESKDQKE